VIVLFEIYFTIYFTTIHKWGLNLVIFPFMTSRIMHTSQPTCWKEMFLKLALNTNQSINQFTRKPFTLVGSDEIRVLWKHSSISSYRNWFYDKIIWQSYLFTFVRYGCLLYSFTQCSYGKGGHSFVFSYVSHMTEPINYAREYSF
jgi:hypothetical protein